MEPDAVATSVEGSPAHGAWVGGGEQATPPAPAATPAPAAPSAPAPTPAAPAAPAPRPQSLAQAGREWLATKVTGKAPAPGTTPTAQPQKEPAVAAAAAAAGLTSEEFLEAMLEGDQRMQIPLTARIPVKRNGKIEYEPISVVRDDLARHADYSRKTAALADQRTQTEQERRQHAVEVARYNAEKASFEAERQLYQDALGNEEKWQEFQQHQEMYRTNATYKANVDRARQADVIQAENTAIHEHDQQQQLHAIAQNVERGIEQLAEQFPGVDASVIRQSYAQALQLGQADLSMQSLRGFFDREAQRTQASNGPLLQEIAELKRQFAELSQQRQAEGHNTETARVLQRDKTGKFLSPAGGNGQAVTKAAPTPYTSSDASRRQREWAKGP